MDEIVLVSLGLRGGGCSSSSGIGGGGGRGRRWSADVDASSSDWQHDLLSRSSSDINRLSFGARFDTCNDSPATCRDNRYTDAVI